DLEHDVVEPQMGDQVGAGRRIRAQRQNPGLVFLAEPELALGTEHALRGHTVHVGDLDAAAARQQCARRSQPPPGTPGPGRRAANAGEPPAPGAHAAEEEPIPAAALTDLALDRLDHADDDTLQVRGDRREARDLDARVHEALARLLRRELHVDELPDPAIRNL